MISINLTYYNEPLYLDKWYQFNEELLSQGFEIKLNICDDGSQIHPASEFFKANKPNANTSLYVVERDLGFNSHGCRNLLMKVTDTDWNYLSDIDCTFDSVLLYRVFEKGHIYRMNKNPNIFFIHKEDFWESGGYDEILVGVHEGDKPIVKYFEKNLLVHRIGGLLIHRQGRNPTHDHDSDMLEYDDDNMIIRVPKYYWPNDRYMFHKLNSIIYQRYNDPVERKKKPIIQFKWHKEF